MSKILIEPELTESILREHSVEYPPYVPSKLEQVLKVDQLNICVKKDKQSRPLVEEVSFSIGKGEMLALVGESGSGKSVTASAVAGMLPNALRIANGTIQFRGEDLLAFPDKKRKQLRGKHISWVFQDYQGSFTPFFKIGNQLVELIRTHRSMSRQEAKEMALTWLARASLPVERVYASYPFQLSGGQRQRVALIAALMLEPALLVADEPTTALDVLTGEMVLNLMAELQRQTGCAVLLISHDLRQVLKRADRVAVMKEGRIVELGDSAQIRDQAKHPYTQMLLDACPRLLGAQVYRQ